MTTKPKSYDIKTALEVLLIFFAFQSLHLQLPLLLWENGGGLSALPLCAEAMLSPDLYTLLLFGALTAFRCKCPELSLKRWELAFCAAFSLCLIIGDSFAAIDSWDLVFSSAASLLLSAVTWMGLTCIAVTALRWAKHLLALIPTNRITLPKLWQAHPFLLPWGIILVCWLPYLLVRLPAAVEHDAYAQLEIIFGLRAFTAHNPAFSTLLIGFWVKLGTAIFGAKEAGLTLFVLFQMLCCSAMLAYTARAMVRMKAPAAVTMVSVAVYALATIYPNYLTTIMKDALYACMTVLLIALIAEELLLPPSKKRLAAILAAALLTGLLRNNGFLLLWALAFASLVYLRIRRDAPRGCPTHKGMTAALLGACVLQLLYANVLLPAANIPAGPFHEMLSVPFQQTARYVRDYPEDITEEEYAVIDAILGMEDLAQRYDPNLSDPVKNACTDDPSTVKPYLKVWLKQFLRHPLVYVEATMNNCYGFFHPNSREYIFCYTTISSNPDLVFDEIEALMPLKIAARYFVMLFESFPLTLPLCNAGCHVWLALYLLGKARERKDKLFLVPFASVGMSMLVCMACPVFFINGVRYALPIIFASPLLIALTTRKQ
ncbi:MAG: hypothetical protein IKK17_02165 [Oscillospiraceae bacterium]|nr:hypothetical protein [Oscillospiraceae bacterium]